MKELLNGKRIDMPPLRQTSVTFRRAPKAKAEIVARLRPIWDDTAGTEDADDLEDLEDVEEEARHVPSPVTLARAPTLPLRAHCELKEGVSFQAGLPLRTWMPGAARAENRKKCVTRYSVLVGLSDNTVSAGMVVPRAAALELAAEQTCRGWAAAQNAPD